MSSKDSFDVIIIGAGPAGSACAYTLAKAGRNVLVMDRGVLPGAKNVTGGRLYTYALELVDENLTSQAALERKVSHEQIMLLSEGESLTFDYHNPAFAANEKAAQSYTILRAAFDQWFAGKAEEQGATLVTGIKVDDILEKDGRIVGIVAGGDEMYADMVIAADGVNSLIAQRAGLRTEIKPHSVGVGVKEIIELPAKTIEQRFNLKEDEGAARLMLGGTRGIHGGSFLYTNRDSISLGMILMPEEIADQSCSIQRIFQELKMHPSIQPLIEGGTTVEYAAHLVAEEGHRGILNKPYRDGMLVVGEAAGYVINVGYTVRGIDLAILSGLAAARAILATEDNLAVGPAYIEELDKIGLLPNMRAADSFTGVLNIPRLFEEYPNLATGIFNQLYQIDGGVPKKVGKIARESMKQNDISVFRLIADGLKGMKLL